jgi:hypothetical protein
MSLAMFAAPFDNNTDSSHNNSDNNIINQKKIAHNKTQKKYPKDGFDTNRVKTVLDNIHDNLDNDTDDDKNKFNPPPKSESVGVQKTIPQNQESMMDMTSSNDVMFRTLGRNPQPNYEGSDDLDLNNYTNYGDDKTNEEYYNRVIPGYKARYNQNQPKNQVNKPYYNTNNYNIPEIQSSDVLIQKLNYMINLLEEQQDERTNNVTEEVVLYSFLGIFIIFIADTFVRAGKYVR